MLNRLPLGTFKVMAHVYILRYLHTKQTEANLAIVFGLTNIYGRWQINRKRKFTGN